jgi:hypothetical protein
MPTSIDEFWKRCVASGLLASADVASLRARCAQQAGVSDPTDAGELAEWLIGRGVLTRYQAGVLLAGRGGPLVMGDFVVLERHDAGRLARTFRAKYKGTQHVTLVFAGAGESAEQTQRMARRAEVARAVKHPHVLRVYQFQGSAKPPYFVLEDLQGQSLREYLLDGRPTLQEAMRIGHQTALGLAALHEQGRSHGSLCPDNVWIEAASTAKLLQFPLASTTSIKDRTGPPWIDYLAPELADPARVGDCTADLYALGCTLYELFAGQVPFAGGDPAEKLRRHAVEAPPRLDATVPHVAAEVSELVSRLLVKDPLERRLSAAQIADRLSAAAGAAQKRPQTLPANLAARPADAVAATAISASLPMAAAPTAQVLSSGSQPQAAAADATAAAAGADVPLIVVDEPRAARGLPRRTARGPLNAMTVAATLALVALAVVGGYWMWSDRDGGGPTSANVPNRPPDTVGPPPAAAAGATERAAVSPATPPDHGRADAPSPPGAPPAAHAKVVEVDDDGQTLWVSPTHGGPLDFRYVPSSAQVILVLRPAEILALDEGARLLTALGPAGAQAQAHLRATLGVELADVEQVVVAFVADESGAPHAAYQMLLAAPIAEAQLVSTWGNPPRADHAGQRFYQHAQLAYWLPPDGAGRVVALAPPALMRELIERDGPPLLRQALEDLVRTSDERRHVHLLVAPSYLLTDGVSLLADELAKLRDPLSEYLDMNVQAVLASAHVGEELFLELRAVGPVEMPPAELADLLRARLDNAALRLEQYVASLAPDPYGRLVVNRFPRMVQLAGNFTRSAAEDRQAVLRCYLPASAAHNLALGAELTLLAERGGTAPAPPAASAPDGANAALDRVVSLSFPRDTLERSLELLSREIDCPIVILGADLQLEGITKNQSFALDERNRSAREILGKILALANPDGKLVYVIKPLESGQEAIHVTTRAAAARRGDMLPAELRTPEGATPAKNR